MFSIKTSKTMIDLQWSFISFAASSFVHLFLRILLGKELGPSGLGTYTLVFTIFSFGMIFAAFGIEAALTKCIAEFEDDLPRVSGFVFSGIIGSFISGLTMGIVLYLLSSVISIRFFHNPEMVPLLKITSLCFPFISIQKSITGALNGFQQMKFFAFVNIVQNVSTFFVSILLVFLYKMGVIGAVYGFVIPTIFIGIFLAPYIKKFATKDSSLIDECLKQVYYFGFFTLLANSISMINTQIDTLLIGHFLNEADVGYYAVGVIIIQGITLMPNSIQRITTPTIAKHYAKKDYLNIKKLVENTMIKTFLLTIFLALLLVILGKQLITILFTESFLPSYLPLIILSIGYSIYSPWISIGTFFSSIGKVNIAFKINAICAILNTILNLVLIPKFGLIGAASATSISLIFILVLNLWTMRRYLYYL